MIPDVKPIVDLDDQFARALPELTQEWRPTPAREPELLVLNHDLAEELGLDADALRSTAGVEILAGAAVPEGAHPVSQGYAGHQFGGYSPRLGDGRAVLLGELTRPDGALPHELSFQMNRSSLEAHFRCAVMLGVDFDGPSHEVGRGIAPQGAHSWGRYSARCGIPVR